METDHYFSRKPRSALRPRSLTMFVNGKELRFKTSSGVFSPKKIDNATLLLIENMQLDKEILDLGCGYGPIGIAAAVASPRSTVLMTEINERAAKLANENVLLNNIPNASIVESDFFEAIKDKKYDTILMNPPMAIGLQRLIELIAECKSHLNPKGTLQIVARHGKGGSRLEETMQNVFGSVKTLAKKSGFRVYMSVNSK